MTDLRRAVAVLPLVAAGMGWVPGSDAVVAQLMPGVAAVPVAGFALPTGFDVIWWGASSDPAVRDLVSAFPRFAMPSVRSGGSRK